MTRLEMIRAAAWPVNRWVEQVAREMGCTCDTVVMHDRGYLHSTGCRFAHPAHHHGADVYWTPMAPAACARVDARLEFVHRNTQVVS